MPTKTFLAHSDIANAAADLVERIRSLLHNGYELLEEDCIFIYGVPRGGIPVAYMVRGYVKSSLGYNCYVADTPQAADFIVDDIIDSGETRKRYKKHCGRKQFLALYEHVVDKWLVFPWEQGEEDTSAEDIPLRLLQFIGEDPERGGLKETPQRFLKAWEHYTSGYGVDPADVLKTFDDGAEAYDQMVIVRDIPVYSHCEHHFAPFFGVASIAYIPSGRIVGLSKLSRLVDIYAKRLQVQERLTNEIANALVEHLEPKGVAVVINCRHMCMEARGIQRQGSSTITSAMRGVLLDDDKARAEFMQLIK